MNSIASSSIRWSALLALSSLAACDRIGMNTVPAPATSTPATAVSSVSPEIAWASSALARNPNLEVLATDATAGVFTVRVKASGEVRAVKLAELAASPVSELVQHQQPTVPAATQQPANEMTPPSPAAVPKAPAPPPIAPVPAPDDTALAKNNTNNDLDQNYTIKREGGKLRVTGPGVSIVSSGTASARKLDANTTLTSEPVICEGSRLLHLDNRVISFAGNGVIARGGCELYITNSTITATGTAVVVGDAVVHIANSTIEGTAASIDADDRARMFVRSSNFRGVPRRAELAVIQDQGGNRWR
jgi:hypothetical protein